MQPDPLALARLFSPPCNPRVPGFCHTPRDTSGHVLTRTERAILWGITAAAVGILTFVVVELIHG